MSEVKQEELQRLQSNHQALLNTTYEKVMLVRPDGTVEYLNPNSAVFINHIISREGAGKVKEQIRSVINDLLHKKNDSRYCISPIGNLFFECRSAPFIGYKGENLHWLILRNPVKRDDDKNQGSVTRQEELNIIGQSKSMLNLQSIVTRVAKTDTTILVTGESGTGKELVAHLLKSKSNRNTKPFLTINCNTISDLLLESDLFGYEKGSFTGAYNQRKGKFEIVDNGTIFLDEIGDISPRMQAALLRVLQNGEITRVGGHTPIKVDVRIIAATNRNLAEAVEKGTFRLDLFYRLNVISIVIPPLRQRKEDIFDLSTYFIQKYNKLFDKSIDLDPRRILRKLEDYHWPGNVRELENVIHRAVLMCKKSYLTNRDITFDMVAVQSEQVPAGLTNSKPSRYQPLKNIIDEVEKEVIINKLKSDHGNVSKTAEALQISKAALYDKMKRYGINAKSLR